MAINCATCGGPVDVTGPCKTCRRRKREAGMNKEAPVTDRDEQRRRYVCLAASWERLEHDYDRAAWWYWAAWLAPTGNGLRRDGGVVHVVPLTH